MQSQLMKWLDLCNASGDLSDEEKVAELLPIQVQQVYVLNRLGKLADAQDLASQITQKESAYFPFHHIDITDALVAYPTHPPNMLPKITPLLPKPVS